MRGFQREPAREAYSRAFARKPALTILYFYVFIAMRAFIGLGVFLRARPASILLV
jgi:hypothetical protein